VKATETPARPLPPLADRTARARHEVTQIEAEIRAGNPALHGLCRGLVDWSCELRRLEKEEGDGEV
jgi:hypothetical protein